MDQVTIHLPNFARMLEGPGNGLAEIERSLNATLQGLEGRLSEDGIEITKLPPVDIPPVVVAPVEQATPVSRGVSDLRQPRHLQAAQPEEGQDWFAGLSHSAAPCTTGGRGLLK